MNQRYRNGSPGDPGDVIDAVFKDFRRNSKNLGPIVFLLFAALMAWSSALQVNPGEVGVVLRLGKKHRTVQPGLNWIVPFVESAQKVNIAKVNRIEVGFSGETARPEESQMLTGDENIVHAQMIVQYRIKDPTQYLFRLNNVESTLHATAEVALRSVVGRTTIDDVLTKGRGDVQTKTLELLQRLMDTYKSGLHITEVKLQDVYPPEEVKEAFIAVNRAREKKEQLINQAEAYKADVIPQARGNAKAQVNQAQAYKEQRVLRAQGDAEKFNSVYTEYEKAKDVTRERLYLETMERVLDKVDDKTIVDKDMSGSTLPVLPLNKAVGAGVVPTTAAPAGGAK